MFKTKLDVRSLFDAHFSTDTTKVLSLLARYLSFSTSKCHTNLTQHDSDDDKIFRQMAPLDNTQFETYLSFWITPCNYSDEMYLKVLTSKKVLKIVINPTKNKSSIYRVGRHPYEHFFLMLNYLKLLLNYLIILIN